MTPDSDPDYWTKWARAFAYNYFNQPEVLRELEYLRLYKQMIEANMTMDNLTYKRNQRVQTPHGPGTITDPMPEGCWLVRLNRADFTPEAWHKLSPKNSPCVFREYAESELKPEAGA